MVSTIPLACWRLMSGEYISRLAMVLRRPWRFSSGPHRAVAVVTCHGFATPRLLSVSDCCLPPLV